MENKPKYFPCVVIARLFKFEVFVGGERDLIIVENNFIELSQLL